MGDRARLTYSAMTLQPKERAIPELEALEAQHDLRYCTKNGGAHVIVVLLDETRFDCWPSSGKWQKNGGPVRNGGFIDAIHEALGLKGDPSVSAPDRIHSFADEVEVEERPHDFAPGEGPQPPDEYEVVLLVQKCPPWHTVRTSDESVLGRFERVALARSFREDLLRRL